MRHRIFVPLESDPQSLKEVEADAAGDGQFRLAGAAAQFESARFKRGEIVECEIRVLANGAKGLVAFRSTSDDPEYRKRRNTYAIFGALMGGFLGVVIASWIQTTATSVLVGLLVGAVIFSFCSVRWGDAAWDFLSRIVRSEVD